MDGSDSHLRNPSYVPIINNRQITGSNSNSNIGITRRIESVAQPSSSLSIEAWPTLPLVVPVNIPPHSHITQEPININNYVVKNGVLVPIHTYQEEFKRFLEQNFRTQQNILPNVGLFAIPGTSGT